MGEYKRELIRSIATNLRKYGYTVYLAERGTYGFYTDGRRVVSFGGHWEHCANFSGNYRALTEAGRRYMGDGWGIASVETPINRREAGEYIAAIPPRWATGGYPYSLTTPEEYLVLHQKSSRFQEFTGDEQCA